VSFHDDEVSVEDSRPRDCYEFVLPSLVRYRLTSATRDVTIDGQTFRAGTIQRGEINIPTIGTAPADVEITMLVSHALPQRWLRGGIPPRHVLMNLYRKQMRSGEYRLEWTGVVMSLQCEKHIAKFRVSARGDESAGRRLPTITVGHECPHILYDQQCQVDRSTFKVTTTAAMLNGREVTLASIGGKPDDWAQWGELLHVASGERMTIQSQVGTAITIQVPIVDMQVGDAVEVYAGCDHNVSTCLAKFANQVNYGGFPHMPTKNPFVLFGRSSIWRYLDGDETSIYTSEE
jgi:uncharacterized phage protein (TIGR02218 family)